MVDAVTEPGPIERVGAVDAPAAPAGAATGAIAVSPLFPADVVVMRTGSDQSSVPFGSSQRDGEAVVAGIRPGETMVIGSPAAVSAAVSNTGGAERSGTVDISHSRSVFAVSGSSASKALEKVCNLDWSDAMMPDGACGSASVAKISCDVIRADADGVSRYLLVCGRSLGQYLYESLIDSAAEFTS